MRVLILSQYYTPEPIPKPSELAQELMRRGHSVSVLTGLPNYPAGRLYPGYSLRLLQREQLDGVPVVRTFEIPYHGKRALGRVLNYLSFMLSAPLGGLWLPPCDVIYVWHPPLTVGVAAWLIARMRGVRFVYDVQDIWPESAVLSGLLRDGWLVRILSVLERFIYRRAGHILVVTQGARDNLLAKGVPPTKISVMPHWVDDALSAQASAEDAEHVRRQHGWGRRFVLLFAGNLGLVQGLDAVVQAAQVQADLNGLLVFVGDGTDKARLQGLVRSLGLEERVQFIDRQPLQAMPAFMAAADAMLVHLRRSDHSRYVVPTKTLAYLAAGKPIVMAMEGAAAELVCQAGAGLVVPPESPEELASAMSHLAKMAPAVREAMGQRGREYLLAHLSKQRVIPQYEVLLTRLAHPGGR